MFWLRHQKNCITVLHHIISIRTKWFIPCQGWSPSFCPIIQIRHCLISTYLRRQYDCCIIYPKFFSSNYQGPGLILLSTPILKHRTRVHFIIPTLQNCPSDTKLCLIYRKNINLTLDHIELKRVGMLLWRSLLWLLFWCRLFLSWNNVVLLSLWQLVWRFGHYCGVIMGAMASLITSLMSVYSTVH